MSTLRAERAAGRASGKSVARHLFTERRLDPTDPFLVSRAIEVRGRRSGRENFASERERDRANDLVCAYHEGFWDAFNEARARAAASSIKGTSHV
jgi:hypothetical protein